MSPSDLFAPAASASPDKQDEYEKVICFVVQGQEFAIPITAVKETIEAPRLTRVPLCPNFIAGLINLRGDVVAVLDLGRLLQLQRGPLLEDLDLDHEPRPLSRRVVLLRGAVRGTTGHGALCGLLVERLTAARKLPRDAIRPPPKTLKEVAASCLRGVARLRDQPHSAPSAPADRYRDPDPEEREIKGSGARSLLLLDLHRLLQLEQLRPYRRSVPEAPPVPPVPPALQGDGEAALPTHKGRRREP